MSSLWYGLMTTADVWSKSDPGQTCDDKDFHQRRAASAPEKSSFLSYRFFTDKKKWVHYREKTPEICGFIQPRGSRQSQRSVHWRSTVCTAVVDVKETCKSSSLIIIIALPLCHCSLAAARRHAGVVLEQEVPPWPLLPPLRLVYVPKTSCISPSFGGLGTTRLANGKCIRRHICAARSKYEESAAWTEGRAASSALQPSELQLQWWCVVTRGWISLRFWEPDPSVEPQFCTWQEVRSSTSPLILWRSDWILLFSLQSHLICLFL